MATDIVPIKTRIELITEVINFIRSRYPNADLIPGTVFRDLLIEAPMDYIADTYQMVNILSYILNLENLTNLVLSTDSQLQFAQLYDIDVAELQTLIGNVLDLYASNYGISRNLGTKASGVLVFYINAQPTTKDLTVAVGTTCRVPNTDLVFQVTSGGTLYASSSPSYDANAEYDSANGVWRIELPAESVGTGASRNVPASSVIQADDTSSGLQVTNYSRFVGGQDEETDISLLGKIRGAYTGNFQGTPASILAQVKSFSTVKDVTMSYLSTDDNKVRKDIMNAVDIFVYAVDTKSTSETVSLFAVEKLKASPSIPFLPIFWARERYAFTASFTYR